MSKEKQFKKELGELLGKYDATIESTDDGNLECLIEGHYIKLPNPFVIDSSIGDDND